MHKTSKLYSIAIFHSDLILEQPFRIDIKHNYTARQIRGNADFYSILISIHFDELYSFHVDSPSSKFFMSDHTGHTVDTVTIRTKPKNYKKSTHTQIIETHQNINNGQKIYLTILFKTIGIGRDL